MIRNNLKIGFRQLKKNKLYSSINVFGLAIGIACMLLALLYVKDEQSFDKFHSNNPNLYRITTTVVTNKEDGRNTIGGTGQVQAPIFKAEVPEIKEYVRVWGGDIFGEVKANDKSLTLRMLFVDPSFFKVFSFPLIQGNPENALNDLNGAVISESTALKLFNTTDVLGKFVNAPGDPSARKLGKPLVITGVVKDAPRNSSLQYDILFSMALGELSFKDDNWLNAYLGTYVVLQSGADLKAIANKFDKIHSVYAGKQIAENKKAYGFDPEISYGLQAMTEIHLNPLMKDGSRESGVVNESKPIFSYLFLGIAAFILFMASINFINISIADSLRRAKEVGIRKVTGGRKSQIIFQFLSESAILCFLAFVLAILLADIGLPLFNQLSGKQIALNEAFDRNLILLFGSVLLGIILVTALYPAFLLSGFKATEVLYGRQKLSGRNLFGKALVVVQFSLAIFFVIASAIYFLQMDFIRTKDLGFNADQVIRTYNKSDRPDKQVQAVLKAELANKPAVKNITFGAEGGRYEVKVGPKSLLAMHQIGDENYLPVMGIKLKAGRNFSASFPSDTVKSVIVNEAFVAALGLTDPIGTQLKLSDHDQETKSIIGVVKNFHFESLREKIKPMILIMSKWNTGGIWVQVEKSKQREGLTAFINAYKIAAGTEPDYFFMDQGLANEYTQERRWQKIGGIATILSLIICCLGLFALAHLATQQRTKEIGIRKVLGAAAINIVALLSKQLLMLVIIAIIIASPFAWLIMNRWLENFQYKIEINWWIFLLAGIAALLIAFITVGFQTFRAAMMNPVKSLRTE